MKESVSLLNCSPRSNLQTPFLCMFLLLLMTIETTAISFKAYPLADNYFEKVYLVDHQNKQYYLTVSCKEQNILSISMSTSLSFEQAPRFNIYGTTENKPKMGMGSYTFLRECQAVVNVDNNKFIQIKRTQDSQPFMTINSVTFSNLHNTFKVVDHSIKWGLGERFQDRFRVVDGKWTLWNRDKPWKIDQGHSGLSDQTYGFQPVYLAREKSTKLYHLMYFKNTFGLLVEASSDGEELMYNSVGGNLHFVIVIGQKDPEELLERYHDFIGPSHIPPFWSMGFHMCRWGYVTVEQKEEVVKKFQQHDLPIDTIWSDLEYMDQKMIFTVSAQTHGGGRLNKLMKTHQVRFVPLIDVGVCTRDQNAMQMGKELDAFLKQAHNGQGYYTGEVWPGQVHFVDYQHPNAFTFWKQQLKRLYEQVQFSGVWLDMNEPSNFRGNEPTTQPYKIQQNEGINQMTINVDIPHYTTSKEPLLHRQAHTYYGHMSTVPTHQFLREQGKRPFIISRSNSVGSGIFAGHWTGDNVATWDFLRLSISGNFLYQIYGIQMVGADICGFAKDTTEQLCSRWMQLGAFYPFSRNHNINDARSQEPYSFGPQLLDTSRESLKTRYALLKSMYTVMVMKQGKGSYFRPISFEFYQDEGTQEQGFIQTQFLIGKALMVTPIVQQGQSKRQVYFPGEAEEWYRFSISSKDGKVLPDSIERHSGKSKATVQNLLPAAAPTFLRGGHLLLLNEPLNRADNLTNTFHLLAALQNGQSFGQIMGLADYENDPQLTVCIEQGCFYELTLKQTEGSSFVLKWTYRGNQGVRASIKIDHFLALESGKKWQHEGVVQISRAQGQQKLEMTQQ